MSDKGYLSDKREKKVARALDGFLNFKEMLPNTKVFWGVIDLGNFMERNDYKAFLILIRLLDDGIFANKVNYKVAAIFDEAITYLENKELDKFNDFVSEMLAGVIDIPLTKNEKAIFLSVMTLLSSFTNLVIDKVNEAIAKSEAEETEVK